MKKYWKYFNRVYRLIETDDELYFAMWNDEEWEESTLYYRMHSQGLEDDFDPISEDEAARLGAEIGDDEGDRNHPLSFPPSRATRSG